MMLATHRAHTVYFVQQYSGILVDPCGRRYVARVYSACRPDDLWDGWFVFFPLDGGRTRATDRETTQSTLAAVRYWASGITTVYLDGALERARALLPEARLARRRAQAEEEEHDRAAASARQQASEAKRRHREFMRRRRQASRRQRTRQQPRAEAADSAPASRRRKPKD